MRLAFCLDGYRDQVGAELRQDDRVVHAVVHGRGELDAIQRQSPACSHSIRTHVVR
jgi:DNA-3-methyladenine glycosylase II